MARLREAELLVGQKLDETASERKRLEGDLEDTRQQLAAAKGELFGAKEELESTRKRGEDLKASVAQLMDRLEVQQVRGSNDLRMAFEFRTVHCMTGYSTVLRCTFSEPSVYLFLLCSYGAG